MSRLKDVYHITEASSATFYENLDPFIDYVASNKLVDVVQKNFLFDIDILSELDNVDADIFWNFGDPFCDPDDNELVVNTIVQSVVSHTYTHAGNYKVHSIVTINGVLFHIEKTFTIEADGSIVYLNPEIILFNTMTSVPSMEIQVDMEGINSTHYIITETDVPPSSNDVNWSITPPDTYTFS